MGYELHVKRLRDGDVDAIDEAEWLEFVDASPEFVLHDAVSSPTPSGDEVALRGPVGCWAGHPSVDLVPFRWSGGQITVSFGDEHAVVGALLAADALGATVVGDDGEEYDAAFGPLSDSPQWEFLDSDEPRSEPVAAEAPSFDAPPPKEELAYDFDGGETVWDRVLPWKRRQRRR